MRDYGISIVFSNVGVHRSKSEIEEHDAKPAGRAKRASIDHLWLQA
jgi:hypothetical protein